MIKLFGASEKEKQDFDLEDDIYGEEEVKEEGQVALDIIEKADEIIIVAPIAGVDLNDIDIQVNSNVLTISGERKKPVEIYSSGFILRTNECFWGRFSRDVILPENLDLEDIKAILEKNVLIIKIAKLRFNNQSITIEKIED
ncbi:MAG: Hsp20/alpha crystallin family protein [Candidatus Gracilibacteria bacterium]|nr:Hsp20/alpha crystallin family protein [Candidatus Gracilibacteria bacterium]